MSRSPGSLRRRSRAHDAYFLALLAATAALFVLGFRELPESGIREPAVWLMAGLTVMSGAWSFVTSGPRGVPLVICPTLCFGFAILLSWGLAPAMIAQAAAVGVVAWRLRISLRLAVTVAAHYLVSFGVAYLVLRVGNPDPLSETGPIDGVADVVAVVGAAAAWLLTYNTLVLVAARLDPAGPSSPKGPGPLG